ncbi:NnrS family protein [Falsihalocynthiibacter sp. SS001]|uniref:NnrS family protein n=1 Tax=Falsihalocynthiibacter sp. SS001 TaxID=3349698 RepID=UPI0036D25207
MARSTAEQMRAWTGPALFCFGFRPFFLFGAIWAVLAMVIWLMTLAGVIDLPSRFDRVSWHAHEFLFGYLGAVLAGFLLTAVPNWTGRLPMVGWRLAALFALWLCGRGAVLFSAVLPVAIAPVVDLAFPLVLGGMILREIVVGKNWRNLIVLALLAIFTIANGLFHIEALSEEYAAQGVGLRLGLATALVMIAVIGGRIIPSFTRNWFVRLNMSVRPTPPMQRFDKQVLVVSILALGLWVAKPFEIYTGVVIVAFGVLHLARMLRWQGLHTLNEPLVFVLHAAYAFIPLGAFALGLDLVLGNAGTAAAQHLWMVGAVACMTIAVMTRATLGHTGRELNADWMTVAIYLCLFGAAIARLMTALWLKMSYVSGVLWLAGFAGFALAYGPLLLRPKPEK